MRDHGLLVFGAAIVLVCARAFAFVACGDAGRWSKVYMAASMLAVVAAAAALSR